MRNLLLIPLLALVAGCITYNYPVVETPDRVYYAEEEPGYVDYGISDRGYVDYSIGYASARHYPWWSLDYLYLGSGYYSGGYSIGFSYGYPSYYPAYDYYPYYYPSYYEPWYHTAWYAPVHYHHHHYYHPYYYNAYWHHRYRNHYGRHHGGHDRYAGHDPYDPYEDPDELRRDSVRDPGAGQRPADGFDGDQGPGRNPAMTRRTSMASSGTGSDRGMVVRNREDAKRMISRTEPAGTAAAPAVAASDRSSGTPAVRRAGGQQYSVVRRESGEVRYRAEPKQRASRTEPVAVQKRQSSSYRAGPLPRTGNTARAATQTRNNGMTVRSPATVKSRQSRVQPVRPAAVRPATAPRVSVAPRSSRPAPPAGSAPPQKRSAAARPAPTRNAARPSPSPRMSAPKSTRNTGRVAVQPGERDRSHRD